MVDQYGVVLQSARGAVVNLPELVVGGPISGSWWAHPRHDEIFRVLNEADESEDVVRLPLVKGKLALVHRRLWPALVRLVDRIGPDSARRGAGGAHGERRPPVAVGCVPGMGSACGARSGCPAQRRPSDRSTPRRCPPRLIGLQGAARPLRPAAQPAIGGAHGSGSTGHRNVRASLRHHREHSTAT